MCDAEASHALLFVATLAVVVRRAPGVVDGGGADLLFDVLMNGGPRDAPALQPALLHWRYGPDARRAVGSTT